MGSGDTGLPQTPNDALLQRLRCIEGHIRGITRMVEEGRSVNAIMGQLQAVNGALDRVAVLLLKQCFAEELLNKKSGGSQDGSLEYLSEILDAMRLR